jgi:hypothetical protein
MLQITERETYMSVEIFRVSHFNLTGIALTASFQYYSFSDPIRIINY